MAFSVQQIWSVTSAEHGQWLPPTKNIGGVLFACMNKWDRGFVRVMHGGDLWSPKTSNRGSCNTAFYDWLVDERQEACDVALAVALSTDDQDAEKRKCIKTDIDFLTYVTVQCPAVTRDGVEVAPAIALRIAAEDVHSKNKIWVELNADTLMYMHTAIKYSGNGRKRPRKSSGSESAAQEAVE